MRNGDSTGKTEQRSEIKALKRRIIELEKALQEHEPHAEAHQKAVEILGRRESELHATLYGIGDAVISTDTNGCVTRMNRTAEELTGWTENEAIGSPLEHVFRIVNETTRCLVENPATRVLREGVVCGLANHTVLISKDGREVPIADSGAPIFDSGQNITGVVLIFRDQTEERLSRRFIETRLTLIEFAANHTLEELLTRALDDVGAFVDSPIGFYHFVESDQKTLSLQQWSTRTLKEFCRAEGRGMHYEIHKAGVWVDCVREGKPVIHNDYTALPHKKGLPEGHARLIRELVVPVFRNGKMVAILGVGNKPVDYTNRDVEIVSFLADVTWEIVCRKRAEEELHHSNEMLRAIIDAAPAAIVGLDPDGNVRSVWNRAAERMFGWKAGEVMGRPLPTIPENRRDEFRRFREREQKGIPMDGVEVCRQRRDGSPIDCSIYSSPFYSVKGDMLGNIAVMVDITERKLAEKERSARLNYFKIMDRINRAIQGASDLEQMMGGVLDEVISILGCERAYLLYPCDPEAETWTVPMERSKPGHAGPIYTQKLTVPMEPNLSEMLRLLIDTGETLKFGSGTEHPFPESVLESYGFQSLITTALHPKTGKAWQFGILQCSSARNWTAAEEMLVREIGRRLTDGLTSLLMYRDLQESEKFLNNIVENIPDMIFVKDAETLKFVKFNRSGEELLGCSRDEILGKNDYELFPEEKAAFSTAMDRKALHTKSFLDIPEDSILNRIGDERILHTKKMPILDEAGRARYLLGISEDITEHRRMDDSVRKLSQAIEQSPVSFVITDSSGSIEFVNKKFTEITGYSQREALGENPRILKSGETSPEEYKRLWETISSGEIWRGEFHNRKKNGELFWEYATIAPIRGADNVTTHYVGIKEDITERKMLEAQFHQAQKMESVGRLAGGVAHDFNNLLGVIIGNTELALAKTDLAQPLTVHLREILKAAEHSADLTKQLLAFARKQPVSPKVIGLNSAVEGVLKMLGRLIGEDIDLSWRPAKALWYVKIDPSQINQILANLCVNARDAIEGVGNIIIETQNILLDEAYCAMHAGFSPGDYALLTVTDDGCGIEHGNLDRIFEPFFTTKELGKGTGLGLATVYGIVKQNSGIINIYSEPNQGTTVKIYLPKHMPESKLHQEQPRSVSIMRGHETILLVEDEPAILKMAEEMLQRFGYRVLSALLPDAAIRVARECDGSIDLLITDVIMPQMTGPHLAGEIRSVHPGVKVLFMSGYTGSIIADHGALTDGFNFIQKPFTAQTLSGKVREVLEKE